jgi:predicted nuclease of predicted toxin-antitoxin system
MLFVFDANCPKKLAEGLEILELGNKRSSLFAEVKHISKLTLPSAKDEEVIDITGRNKGILITYDTGFKSNKHRYQLYRQKHVGVILYHSFRSVIFYWDIVKAFVDEWEKLKEFADAKKPPFLLEISVRGFHEIDIDEKGKSKEEGKA